jgi:hypothetical protein
MSEHRCAHVACACRPLPGALYCCSGCETADHRSCGLSPRRDCGCEHAECRPEHVAVEPLRLEAHA